MTARRQRTLILGEDQGTVAMTRQLSGSTEQGYDLVGSMAFPVTDWAARKENLERRIRSQNIDHLLVSSRSLNGSLEYLEDLCSSNHIRLSVFSSASDSPVVRDRLETIGGMPLLPIPSGKPQRVSLFLKRTIDVAGASLLALSLFPFCLIVAILSKFESGGPVIFRQRRCLSAFDLPFFLYKFRSMHHGADEIKGSLKNESEGPLFKVKNDPRVTRIGRFMRRFSIDELPQLLNVLKGEMSLVGPRPLPAEDFARFQEESDLEAVWRLRSRAKPGITGLWQTSGRSDLGVHEMLLLDLYYIRHRNALLDIRILFRTIPAVLLRRGAY